MHGGYELASMPLKKATKSSDAADSSNNDTGKSEIIKDQIIGKLHEQNQLLKERLVGEESHSHVVE